MSRRAASSIVVAIAAASAVVGPTIVDSSFVGARGLLSAADGPIPLAEVPANLFGGAELAVRVNVGAKSNAARRVAWSLEAVEHRAIARGEAPLGADETAVDVTLQLPPVKEGVVLPLVFTAAVVGDEGARPVERKLWLFPESPWTDRAKQLKELEITLFDPVGTLAEILTSAQVPFTETRNTAALGELAAGTIVVAEGVDLREYPELSGILRGRAAAGLTVFCLAPTGGVVPFTGAENDPAPTALRFARDEIVAEFGPHLELRPRRVAADAPAVRGWLLRGEGTGVVLESSEERAAWPWIEMKFGAGRLVLCHLPVVTNWQSGPAPRFFLAQLLLSQSASHPRPTEP